MDKAQNGMNREQLRRIWTIGYGLLLSAVIALIAFLFLQVEANVSHHLWHLLPLDNAWRPLYIIVLLVIGTGVLYLIKQRWGNVPATAHDTMHELKAHQTVDYSTLHRQIIAAIWVLIMGAGVGPEATLLSILISLSIWQADKMRYLYYQFDELMALPTKERAQRLLHPFDYATRYTEVDRDFSIADFAKKKKILTGAFIANGLMIYWILSHQVEHAGFITKLGETSFEWQQVWIVIPCWFIGLAIGWGLKQFANKITEIVDLIPTMLQRLILGGTLIATVGIFTPDLLFSGQHSVALISEWSQTKGFWILLAIAVLKLLFLAVCLRTGWVGGDIFPYVFVAFTISYAVSGLVPQFDQLLIVAMVAASIATMLQGSVWLSGIFIMLFLPFQLWSIMLIVIVAHHFATTHLAKYLANKTA